MIPTYFTHLYVFKVIIDIKVSDSVRNKITTTPGRI